MSSAVSCVSGTGAGTETESFFACPVGALVAEGGAALVVEGRAVVDLEEAAREARETARDVGASAAGREVSGLFAAVVVVDGARECLEKVFPGEARVGAPGAPVVLLAADLLFSSPDVTDERSGSTSEVVLEASPVLRAAVPAAGRVGGLFKLDPTVLVREVAVDGCFDALEGALAPAAGGGRRAPVDAVAPEAGTVGRRGGTASLVEEVGGCEAMVFALAAILRRIDDDGVEGCDNCLRCGLPACTLSAGAMPELAWVESSMGDLQGWSGAACTSVAQQCHIFALYGAWCILL